MSDLRDAAQQFVTDYENGDLGDLKHYARALRAALEQPEQEEYTLVAWFNGKPVYSAPPRREWRGLTEEEIRHFAWNGFLMAEGIWDKDTEEDLLTFARAIEQACKERNP